MEGKERAILLIEDDQVLEEVLSTLLQEEGYTVESTHVPEDMGEILKKITTQVEIILCDMGAFTEVKNSIRTAFLKQIENKVFIGMSGKDKESFPEEQSLMDTFIQKPFTLEELIALLEGVEEKV